MAVAQRLRASERREREVTEELYATYRALRARLFEELRRAHSSIPVGDLVGFAQTILDRALFIAFAEDRRFLPKGTIAKAFGGRGPDGSRSMWPSWLALFRSVDKGSEALDVPAHRGGLFREIAALDELEVSDAMCKALAELGEYDFGDDASVGVLGHIFERSLADLEQLRREAKEGVIAPARAREGTSRRKTEGIFYTPSFLTSFLVRETLGRALAEAWERAAAGRSATKKDLIATWEAYQKELRAVRVLDPACGSGALLMAAFDALAHEIERVSGALAELGGPPASRVDLTKAAVNENLFGVDKSGESVEITKLSLWLKTAARGGRLTRIDQNIREGNSVVSDPAVDPWAFDWKAGRAARCLLERDPPPGGDASAIDARWGEGFDVVIGNPPYVRHERLADYKDHWRSAFQAYDGAADLFVYFFERGLMQLKPGGRLGYIVSNKWLRGGYAERLRALLAREYTIDALIDFGHAPLFRDADAFPMIITIRKAPPPPEHAVSVTLYPREELGKELIASYAESHRFPIAQAKLSCSGWILEPASVQALLEKMRRSGQPLGEYARVKPYYGMKTGCNEAFLVDQATKERLCKDDARSSQILKKYLRGQDLARWAPEQADVWFLVLRSSNDFSWPWASQPDEGSAERVFAQSFPAVYRHLKPLEAKLRRRTDRGRFWWELRSCAYYGLFDQPKLLYPDILWRSSFCLAPAGVYTNNTNYLLPTDDLWLLCCLNAPATWSYLWRTAQHAKDEALRMFGDYVTALPIAMPTSRQRVVAREAASEIISLTQATQRATSAVLDLIRVQHGIESVGQALGDFASLGSDAFVSEVAARRPKKGAALSPAGLTALRALFDAEAPGIIEKRTKIAALERDIAGAVHAAYGLNEADLALLRATAPPRTPPDW